MQPNALMTWQPQHQLRFITLSQHFITEVFTCSCSCLQQNCQGHPQVQNRGLELLVNLRQWENRCEGRHQGDFGNIYVGAHNSTWRKLKYKTGIEKLASGANWMVKDDFKEGIHCGGPQK